MLAAALLATLAPQTPTTGISAPGDSITVQLETHGPDSDLRLRWSPKGAKVPLSGDRQLTGAFDLGGRAVRVELSKSDGSNAYDQLRADLNQNGLFESDESMTCTPNERRGKTWSSFGGTATLRIDDETTRDYPLNFWFVRDPQEPDAEPVLRWGRRGWRLGEVEIDGAPAYVLVSEMKLDGIVDQADSWHLGRTTEVVLGTGARSITRHQWLDGKAWHVVKVDPHGRHVTIEPFDPGITEEDERAAEDRFAADRAFPRAPQPVAFRHDVDAAIADAKRRGKRVFLDFETTWCGPCKQMDRLVYTAQPVVSASADLVCIKVDGDERRDLVKHHRVRGYPTMVVLGTDGNEVRRALGYQSVAETVRLMRK